MAFGIKSIRPLFLIAGLCAWFAASVPVCAQQPPSPSATAKPVLTDAEKEQQEKIVVQKQLAKLPEGSSSFLDVPYVAGTKTGISYQSGQRLDLFVPPGKGPFPLIICIHGGGWHAGGKEGFGIQLALKFLPQGFALASLDYRWVQDAPFPAQIEDCNTALIWLRKNATLYHLDPDHVGAVGHSAGAHLTALMAVTGDSPKFSPDPAADVRIQAAVCWATPADLDRERGQWPEKSFVWNPRDPFIKFFPNATYDGAFARMASPASYVHAGVPPILILHGGKDTLVPIGQASAFADALKKAGVDAIFRIDPERDHNVVSEAAIQEAIQFFKRTLTPPSVPEK